MKALSLTQPWATLVALGAKQWETRSWGTSYREVAEFAAFIARYLPERVQIQSLTGVQP